MAWLIEHEFLLLALLFAIPGLVIVVLRPDLRSVAATTGLCALPFAATEWLFYPDYWSPKFLFDLVDVLGLGIEDLLFVVGLAAFTSTCYAFVFRRRYVGAAPGVMRRASILLGTLLVFALIAACGVAVIFAAISSIAAATLAVTAMRRDLAVPAVLGGVVSLAVYAALCWVFSAWIPGVFDVTWHTEQFLGLWVAGLPLEELLYGLVCGACSTTFFPFLTGARFAKLEPSA